MWGLPFVFFYNVSTGIFAALGDSTLAERREMMVHQKELLEAKKREIEESLAVADRKIAYYDQAIADGTEAYAKEKYMKERTGECNEC